MTLRLTRFVASFLVLAVLVSAGCGGRYLDVPAVPADAAKQRPTSIAIYPLTDERKAQDKPVSGGLLAIPVLVWWSSWYKSKFDVANLSRVGGAWTHSYQRALAEELKRTGAFDEVVFAETDAEARKHPFIVRGRIIEAAEVGSEYSYGLSILAKYLHYIGIPEHSRYWKLVIEYQVSESVELKPVGKPRTLEVISDTDVRTRYAAPADMPNHDRARDNMIKAAAAYVAQTVPPAGSTQLASLVDEHRKFQLRRETASQLAEKLTPPVLTLSSPRNNTTQRTADVQVDWIADAIGGLKSVSMSLNGKPVDLPDAQRALGGERESAPRRLASSTPVKLAMGANNIEIVLVDHLEQSLTESVAVKRLPQRLYQEKRTAVVIGVSEYDSGDLAKVASPGQRNAEAFAAYLTDEFGGQMPTASVTTLLGGAATRQAVLDAIASNVRDALAGDTVLLYFSGLSIAIDRAGPAYLLVAGSDLNSLAGTAISLDELSTILTDSLAENTILIVDAAFPVLDYELTAQGLLVEMVRSLRNVGVLVSNDRPAPAKGGGSETFTDLLLGALTVEADLSRDGVLSLDEASEALRNVAGDAGLSPRLSGRYNRDLPLKMLE